MIGLYTIGAVLLGMGAGLVFLALLEMDREGWREIRGHVSERWLGRHKQ